MLPCHILFVCTSRQQKKWHFSPRLVFFWGVTSNCEGQWHVRLEVSCLPALPYCSSSSALFAPECTDTFLFQGGLYLSPACPRAAPVLLVQQKEQMNWISTRRKKPTELAGASAYLSAVLTKTFPIFPLLDRKCMWPPAHRHLLLSDFVVKFPLESKNTTPPSFSRVKAE